MIASTWKIMEMSNYSLKIMAHLHYLPSARTREYLEGHGDE